MYLNCFRQKFVTINLIHKYLLKECVHVSKTIRVPEKGFSKLIIEKVFKNLLEHFRTVILNLERSPSLENLSNSGSKGSKNHSSIPKPEIFKH